MNDSSSNNGKEEAEILAYLYDADGSDCAEKKS
jgi:hypothetical protein